MITLIGVGHVFALSESIKDIIRSKRPEVVCLELDPLRFQSLLHRGPQGDVPIQYKLLAYLQKRLAGKFGTQVGDEMLAAADAAREVGAKLALIDMDGGTVMRRLWGSMTLPEKIRMMGSALVGVLVSRERVEKELERYEGNEERYIEGLAVEFPTVKEILIDDRNRFMAEKLTSISSEHKTVVAVVGDGHVSGLMDNLKAVEVEAVRLKDIRKPSAPEDALAEVSTTYWYRGQ
ncbi:MAG TPA: TraB/GumN family protein [Thermoplasmata archaeon]|jgi:pheromone shutdown protein TraB